MQRRGTSQDVSSAILFVAMLVSACAPAGSGGSTQVEPSAEVSLASPTASATETVSATPAEAATPTATVAPEAQATKAPSNVSAATTKPATQPVLVAATAKPTETPGPTPTPTLTPTAAPTETPVTWTTFMGQGFLLSLPSNWTVIELDNIEASIAKIAADNPGFSLSGNAIRNFKAQGGQFLAVQLSPALIQSSAEPFLAISKYTHSTAVSTDDIFRVLTTQLAQSKDVIQPAEVKGVRMADGSAAIEARYAEKNFHSYTGSIVTYFFTDFYLPAGTNSYWDVEFDCWPADEAAYRSTFDRVGKSFHGM